MASVVRDSIQAMSRTNNGLATGEGLKIQPQFCPQDVADPFDTVEWDLRSAQIKDESGGLLFEQTDCEIPKPWSQLATNVVVSKYFYGENGTSEREKSVRQLIHRVARTIADWGIEDGYFASADDGETFYRDLAWLCLHQHGSFNSPVWFNVGLHHQYQVHGARCNWHWNPETRQVEQPENPYEHPQGSACFIQSVDDNMESIMRLATSEAMLFKFGSGTGTDLSTIRSHREKLAGGGKPSGPLSFMRVYDQVAAVVKSGGKTRRAAKMQSLKVWHPDIMEFIECKWKEEQKARCLIEKGGYESNFNGEAYSSILFQNANLSVRVTDEFMQAVERGGEWKTRWISEAANGDPPSYPARKLLDRMAECAWHCGDPGVQYDTTINRWHTCPNSGRINASNPCVTGDTLVSTDSGLRRIEDLVGETPLVMGRDGELHRATRVFPTGIKPVFRLRTSSGYELTVTADHLVETHKRGNVRADELTPEDELVLLPITFGSEWMSEVEAEELGHDVGSIAIQRAASSARILAIAGTIVDAPVDREFVLSADEAESIRFSDRVFGMPRDSVAAVIRGMYRAQREPVRRCGFNNAGYSRFRFRSEELRRQVQVLLLGFGIHSFVQEHSDGESELLVNSVHKTRFDSLISGDVESCIDARPIVDSFASLSPLGEQMVFDLTEPVTQHFVANGIVVHNCSEYMFLDDTACNLSSINLMKFRLPDGKFDVERFKAAARLFFIAQEILVDHASYPTDRIAENSHKFRPLGLGYANLGTLIMTSGAAYDSDAAYGLCGSVTALLHGAANLASAELAAAMGAFEGYEENRDPMLRVMQMHRDAVDEIENAGPRYLKNAARELWDAVLASGRMHGFRNAQATVLAPTGTISFMMDCDTTGIEPDIALVKYKQLAGGGMLKIINRSVPMALRTLGYDEPQIESVIKYIDQHDTIEGSPDLDDKHLPVFDCAFKPAAGVRSISWRAHVRMMAAAQPFLSGAISKTVNMPADVAPQDVADAYQWGWKLGLKALAIYRDGSKQSQPLSTKSESGKAAEKEKARPRRERLPDTRRSVTHKFNVGGHEGYINVGLYPDGRPGELFITMAKEGSTIGGLMDCFGTAISINLQYGVPLEVLVNKFSHTRFEPMGHTTNPDVRFAKSIVDYIFRWLGIEFLSGYREAIGLPPKEGETGESPATATNPKAESNPAAPAKASAGGSPGGISPENGAAVTSGATATNGKSKYDAAMLERAGAAFVELAVGGEGDQSRSEQFARFQSDAPPCDNCGSITVRNGNCYLCHNCGNSMGCS